MSVLQHCSYLGFERNRFDFYLERELGHTKIKQFSVGIYFYLSAVSALICVTSERIKNMRIFYVRDHIDLEVFS